MLTEVGGTKTKKNVIKLYLSVIYMEVFIICSYKIVKSKLIQFDKKSSVVAKMKQNFSFLSKN